MNDNKQLVYRAGLIPYIVNSGGIVEMMFMIPSDSEYGGDRPQLAKGKIDGDESAREAAIREAKEELGLFMGNVLFTEELGVFMGRTTVFVSKVKNKGMFGEPSFETQDTRWMTLEEFMVDGRELHRPVIQAAHRLICKLENIEQE